MPPARRFALSSRFFDLTIQYRTSNHFFLHRTRGCPVLPKPLSPKWLGLWWTTPQNKTVDQGPDGYHGFPVSHFKTRRCPMRTRNCSPCVIFAIIAMSMALNGAARADVEFQPLSAQAKRVIEAMDLLGAPLSANDRSAVLTAAQGTGGP